MVSWKIQNTLIREFLAEFLGTFTLVCLGCSANAVIKISSVGSDGLVAGSLAWSLALTVAIYVSGGVSGGHVNPAVTLGLASIGKLPWSKVGNYFLAQYLGAFVGALMTFIVYREGIINTIGINNQTMGIFGTFSNENVTVGTALIDQILSTGFFLLIICAIVDKRNMSVSKGLIPLLIGFINVGVLSLSYGYNCGTPINPARDFSPRVFSAIAGWGGETFSYNNFGYFWIPIVGCHIGGVLGCWAYKLFIENHWPKDHYDFGQSDNESPEKQIRITQLN